MGKKPRAMAHVVVSLLLGLLVLVVDGGGWTREFGEGGIHFLQPPYFGSNNNMVDEQSKIIWGKMTNARRYVNHIPRVTLYEQFVSDVTRGFMNMIRGRKMSVGVLGKVLTGVLEDGKTSKLNQAYLYSPGYQVFLGVFLAWALTMPWIGIFIFFSRNLGYFGGHRYQAFDHNRDVRKRELSCLLASLIIVLSYSCLMGFSSNYHLVRGVDWNKDVLHNHMTDFEIYLDNSIKEIEYIVAKNFEFAAEVIGRDLANIGYLVGEPTSKLLKEGDGISTHNFKDFPTNLETISEMTLTSGDLLIEAESRLREGRRESRALASTLRGEADKLRRLQRDTSLCPPTPALCGSLNASLLALEVNFQQIPDISEAVRNFSRTISNEGRFTRTLQESGHALDVINYRLDDNMRRGNTEKVFFDMARDYQNLCYKKLNVLRQIQKSTGESLNKFRRKIDHLTWDTTKYAVMWWSVGLTVFTLTAVVAMLQSVALAIGTFANWTSVVSTKRSKLSDLAGDLLMTASKIIFSICWVMTLTACVLFPVNCVFETAFCQPLMDEKQEAIKALLDNPGSELLAGQDHYFFGEVFLSNKSVKMKMSDIINRCALDQPIMKVLKYERVYNVDETVPALAKMVSVPRLLSGVNVSASDVDVLKPACLDTLGSVRAAVQNNYTAILDELNKNTLRISLSHFEVELKTAARETATRRQARRILEDIASKLGEIRSSSYPQVRNIKRKLVKNFEQLRNDFRNLPNIINTTMEAMLRVQQTLRQRGPTLIVPALRIFERRLNHVLDQYRGQVHNVKDTGKCLSFFEKHQQFVNLAICKKTISAFNGYWVALMLCVIIMPLCIVVNFKLSRYFHCMEMADQTEIELFDPNALGGLQQGSYNVLGELDNIPDIFPLNLQQVGSIMANHSTDMKDATNNLLSYFNTPERQSINIIPQQLHETSI